MLKCVWTTAIVTVILAAPAVGQTLKTASERLAKATSLKCTFTAMAVADWKDGDASVVTKPAKLSVSYTNVDTEAGSADAVGDSGKSHITVRVLGAYLHFMQLDPYGALHVTTVFDRESRGGRLRAAHSRHEYLPTPVPTLTSRPEQYVGDCEVK
jgi:hypothetical protein